MAGKENVVSKHLGIFDFGEAGKSSSCVTKKAQTDGTIPIIPATREARLKILREAKESVMNQSRTPTPKIQKVIFFLRDHKDFQKYYKPRVVSVGPIRYDNKGYRLGEDCKRLLTARFVDCSGKTREHLYKKIKEKIKELRDCFDEEVTKDYDDEALAWLMYLDGCAILQYIYMKTNNPSWLLMNSDITVAFGQDLFLLENQVPYCLLKWLMSLSDNEEELRASIETYIESHLIVPEDSQRIFKDKKPIHLLDLLRTSLLGKPHANSDIKREQHWQSCRNLQDLKAAGICLKRSSNSCLRNISFSGGFHRLGHLYLPPIPVDYLMRRYFLNLIAYEMCPDFESDLGVTSYICFLHSLIDEAKDVQELRKAGIFYNAFGRDEVEDQLLDEIGRDEEVTKLFNEKFSVAEIFDEICSDEKVAKLFNEIGTNLVCYTETYKLVQIKIENHYDRFRFSNDHLGDIWFIAVYLAALLSLTLLYWMFRF